MAGLGDEVGGVEIGVHADTDGLAGEISRGTKKAAEESEAENRDTFTKSFGKAGTRAGDEFGRSFVRDAAGRLHDARTGAFVSEGNTLGKKLGDSIGDGAESKLKERVNNLGKILTPNWLKTIGLWVAILGPPALQLAAVLAPAVGLIGAIVPAALGAAASIGVLKAAFNGVGQAIKDIGTAKFADDLKKLAPAARSFVQEIAKSKPVLHQLQQDIQQAFFLNLQGDITRLVKVLIPQLRFELIDLSSAFGDLAHNVLAAFSNTENAHRLNNILEIFSDTVYDIGQGLQPLVHALLVIGQDAAPMLDDAAKAFQRFAFWFDHVITTADHTGKLQSFFSAAETALGQIYRIGKDAVSIIVSLLDAAGKAGGGGAIISLFDSLASTIATLDKNGALTEVFQVFNELFSVLGTLLPPLLPALSTFVLLLGQTLTGDIKDLAPGLKDIVENGFVPLLVAATGLIPVLNPLVSALVSLINAMAGHASIVLTVIAAFITWWTYIKAAALAEAITKVVIAVGEWTIAQLGLDVALDANPIGAIVLAVEALIAGIVLLVLYLIDLNKKTDFIGKIGDALKAAGLAVWHFLQFLGGVIADFFTKTVPGYWDDFVAWAKTVPGMLLTALEDLAKGLLEGIGIGIGLALAAIIETPALILHAFEAWGKFFLNFWTNIFPQVLAIIAGFIGMVIQKFLDLTLAVQGEILHFAIVIEKGILKGVTTAVHYVATHLDQIVDYFTSLPNRIAKLAVRMGVVGLQLIKAFFKGLASGAGKAADIGTAIYNHLKGYLNSAIKYINKGIHKIPIPGLPSIPLLAKGGIISKPTLAIIGERRPEVVLPTDDPIRAAQLLRQSGLAASMNIGAPNVSVTVKIGERELEDIVDTQIATSNAETNLALAHGSRG